MKRIMRLIAAIIIFFAAYGLLKMVDVVPSLGDLFRSKEVTIDETPIIITQIKAIGQLVTYSFFDEVVVHSRKPTRGSSFVNSFNRVSPISLPSADKEIVLIGKGKVLAGTNLSMLTATSVTIKNDTVHLYLPKPQILETILNPSDFETFSESGEWSNAEVVEVKARARQKMIDRALQQNILQKAGDKSKAIMANFLGKLGYKKIYVY